MSKLMSNRVSKRAFRNIFALTSVAVATVSLSGCTMLGTRAFGDPDITGSAATVAQADVNQAMPQAIGPAPFDNSAPVNSTAKYLPPADIGNPFDTRTAMLGGVGQGGSNVVVSQELPSLGSSPALGSTKTMPAQSMPLQVASNSQPPVPVASPRLSVVAEKTYVHIIEAGESLHSIARKYDVTTDAIVLANGLPSPDRISVGQKITIPGRPEMLAKKKQVTTTAAIPAIKQPKFVTPAAPSTRRVVGAAPKPAPTIAPTQNTLDKFRWPASGEVITDFAASKGTGINIKLIEGTAIRAAETGTVIYVGSAVEGYGNLILIKHENSYVSAYAHLSQITVSKGDSVVRGDAIGLAGMTGSVNSPQLHFEIRQGATPVDPMPMLAS